eukprot:tig00020563_g11237.t2
MFSSSSSCSSRPLPIPSHHQGTELGPRVQLSAARVPDVVSHVHIAHPLRREHVGDDRSLELSLVVLLKPAQPANVRACPFRVAPVRPYPLLEFPGRRPSFASSASSICSQFASIHFQRGLQLSLGLRAQLFAEEALVTILYGFHAGLEKQRPAFLVVLRAQARVVVLQGEEARWSIARAPVVMVPVLLPCPLHRRSPSFSASGSAPFGTGTQCSSRFIVQLLRLKYGYERVLCHFTFRARQGARPWLTRALLPAASGSLFCSVPLGAPMYRSCQAKAPPRAREFPRASSLEMGAFRNSVGSRGTPSFSCNCVIRRRGGEVPVGHELQAVRDAGLHYGLDKVAGLVRGLRSWLLLLLLRGGVGPRFALNFATRKNSPATSAWASSVSLGFPITYAVPGSSQLSEEGIVEDQPVQRRLDTALRQPALELELVGEAVTGDCPRPAAPEYVPVELDVPLGMYRGFLNSFASSRTALKTWRASSVEQPGARSGGQWSASRPPPAG